MSDIRDPERDQQLPAKNSQPYIQDLVIADIAERKEHGVRKYGTALQAFNGRSFLQDAYEECIDLAVYLKGRLEEERQNLRKDFEELDKKDLSDLDTEQYSFELIVTDCEHKDPVYGFPFPSDSRTTLCCGKKWELLA